MSSANSVILQNNGARWHLCQITFDLFSGNSMNNDVRTLTRLEEAKVKSPILCCARRGVSFFGTQTSNLGLARERWAKSPPLVSQQLPLDQLRTCHLPLCWGGGGIVGVAGDGSCCWFAFSPQLWGRMVLLKVLATFVREFPSSSRDDQRNKGTVGQHGPERASLSYRRTCPLPTEV